MMKKNIYYKLDITRDIKNWCLGIPFISGEEDFNFWPLANHIPIDLSRYVGLRIDVLRSGKELDVNCGCHGILLVHTSVARELHHAFPNSLQRVPIHVEGSKRDYEVLLITSLISCFDFENSEWEADEDREGEVAGVWSLSLKEEKVPPDIGLFRITEWPVPLMFTESAVNLLKAGNFTGLEFVPTI